MSPTFCQVRCWKFTKRCKRNGGRGPPLFRENARACRIFEGQGAQCEGKKKIGFGFHVSPKKTEEVRMVGTAHLNPLENCEAMPNYRRSRSSGGTFFFTIVTYRRRPFLTTSPYEHIFWTVMHEVAQNYSFTLNAWVLLPDHLHCVWTLPDRDGDYSKRWGMIKAGFSKRVLRMLPEGRVGTAHLQSPSRIRHREAPVWQRRFWEHEIRNPEDYRRHVDYIHFNPVKHSLVSRVRDWPHSSFHEYGRDGHYSEDWGGEVEQSWAGDFGEF